MPDGPKLTMRQAEIAALVAKGKTSREIGALLSIKPRTVDWHIDEIKNKLDVENRLGMLAALSPSPSQVLTRTNPLAGKRGEQSSAPTRNISSAAIPRLQTC